MEEAPVPQDSTKIKEKGSEGMPGSELKGIKAGGGGYNVNCTGGRDSLWKVALLKCFMVLCLQQYGEYAFIAVLTTINSTLNL